MVERVAVNHQNAGPSPEQENPEEMRGFLIYQSLEGREVYPDSEAYWEVIFPVTLENKASSNSSFEL